jgi:hypothetical protein
MVIDLYGGNACHPAVELLALLRNELVGIVNQAEGMTKIGAHLFAFDALYMIWKVKTEREGIAIPLIRTARERVGHKLAKISINFATMGAMNWAGDAAEAAQIFKDLGWETEGAIDMAREKATDNVFERTVKSIENFIHRAAGPRLSSRLRAAIGGRQVLDTDFPYLMHDLLLDAIHRTQAELKGKASLMIFLDAIDEADDDTVNTGPLRFVLAGVALNARNSEVSAIFGGRRPCDRWQREGGQSFRLEPMGTIPVPDVRARLQLAGLGIPIIDRVVEKAGGPQPVSARSLSEAFISLGLTTT